MLKLHAEPKRRRFADDGDDSDDVEPLRAQLLDLIRNADGDMLAKVADALSAAGFDENDSATFKPNTDNLPPPRDMSERRRAASPAKFSESQRGDFERVKRYVEANRRDLDRIRPGNADEMLSVFGEAIFQGYTARDLLPRGA